MKTKLFIVTAVTLALFGCQSSPAVKQTGADNASFMSLWKTYSHCQDIQDVDLLKQDAIDLHIAARASSAGEGFVLPLPGKLQEYVTTPRSRYAVDVKAMSAACSLRAGQAALEIHRFDVAEELLQEVLAYAPQSEYAYYSLQARTLLSEIPPSIQVTRRIP